MIDKILDRLPIVSCQEATKLMSEAMERQLSIKEIFNLKLHLYVCELCVRFQKQIKSLRKLLLIYRSQSNNQHTAIGPTLSVQAKTQIKLILKTKESANP